MPYHLWMGNIVNIATDAIVNAANTELKRTPGICEAIFAAADSAKLEEAWPTSWPLSYRTFCDDAVLWAGRPAILFTWPDLAGLEARSESGYCWQTATAAP